MVVCSVFLSFSKTSESLDRVIQVFSEVLEFYRQIEGIIDVIDDISDQTNLLSLNASIEAARAGEKGKGFTVVAEEVRKLSGRVREEAKNIGEIIRKSISFFSSADESLRGVRELMKESMNAFLSARKSFDDIVSSTEKVQIETMQISTSMHEQSAIASEVAKNIESISVAFEKIKGFVDMLYDLVQSQKRVSDKIKQDFSFFKVE